MKIQDKLTLEGKATIGTGLIAFGGLEGLMHMGSAGFYVASAVTILTFLHGNKVARAANYVKDKVIAEDEVGSLPVALNHVGAFSATGGVALPPVQAPSSVSLGNDRKGHDVSRELSALKSILILALPGQGKSSYAAYLLCQIIEQGGRIAIIDRHARSDESLSAMLSPFEAAFSLPPAHEPDGMMRTLEFAEDTLNARMEGNQPSDAPFFLVIDEMTDILKKLGQKTAWGNVAQRMADVVEGYNSMGRKYNCFALAIGQLTNASRTGGTEIRELFTTRLIGGMQQSQAVLVLPKEIASQCPNLQAGEWIASLEGKQEPFKVTAPMLTKERIQRAVASIVCDPLEELAEAEDVDPDDSRYGSGNTSNPVTEELIQIGIDNSTKEAVHISQDTFTLFLNAARAGNPLGFRSIQALVGCSEAHARNIAKDVADAVSQPVE